MSATDKIVAHVSESQADKTTLVESVSPPAAAIPYRESAEPAKNAPNSHTSEPIDERTGHAVPASLMSGWGKQICIGILLFLFFACGLVIFKQRTGQESLFNRYVDAAQVIDLKNQALSDQANASLEANIYWRKALAVAEQLGENKRILADLNVKAAGAESNDDDGQRNRRLELEKAVAIYAQVPNAVSAQTEAIASLVSTIVPPAWNETRGGSSDSPSQAKLCKEIDFALSRHQLEKAINLCRHYVDKEHNSATIASRLKPIVSQLTAGQPAVAAPLIEKAIPLFEDCVYYHSGNIEQLRDERLALDVILNKGGYPTKNRSQLLKLANKSLAEKDDHGAFIYLHRCLGHGTDPALTEKLRKVNRSIRESDWKVKDEDIAECIDLLNRLRSLQVKAFGQTSSRVLDTDRQLCQLKSWLGHYTEAIRRLEYVVAKSSPESESTIYELASMYSAQGDCPSAIDLLRSRIGGDFHANSTWSVTECLVNQAALFFQSDQYDKASRWIHYAQYPFPNGEVNISNAYVRPWH